MEWLGHARTSYHHHPTPITMSLKSTPNGPTPDPVPLPALIASVTPPCRLTPTLPNGHAQTIYAALTKEDVPLHYRRRVFPSTDPHYPGSFAVDFVLPHPTPADCARAPTHPLPPRTHPFTDAEWAASWGAPSADATPVLVALHGLSGGSYEQYLKEVLAPLVEAGWGALVVNARGCARSVVTTPRLFNARSTWDVRQVVRWLRATHPARPVFAVGFSLGANILVNVSSVRGSAEGEANAVAVPGRGGRAVRGRGCGGMLEPVGPGDCERQAARQLPGLRGVLEDDDEEPEEAVHAARRGDQAESRRGRGARHEGDDVGRV